MDNGSQVAAEVREGVDVAGHQPAVADEHVHGMQHRCRMDAVMLRIIATQSLHQVSISRQACLVARSVQCACPDIRRVTLRTLNSGAPLLHSRMGWTCSLPPQHTGTCGKEQATEHVDD